VLAPVLARLSGIHGVTGARVECSGTYFHVEAASPAALEAALPAIRAALGASARVASDAERDTQLAARGRGEPWFSVRDVRALSYVEARVLAARMLDAATAAVELDAAAAEGVHEALRVEITAALERAHDEGGRSSSGWFWGEWPRIVERVSARLAAAIGAREASTLGAALRARGGGERTGA
jgi:hypothetical protein